MTLKLCLAAFGAAFLPLAATAEDGTISVERGLQISIIGGCHDCHTPGYSETEGKIDPVNALIGNPVGFQGPWGTTYAANLRLTINGESEDDFVKFAKTFKAKPPMPYFNVHAMDESDLRSLYLYIGSLGEPGNPAPEALPPGVAPPTPYVVMAPPTMPNG